MFRTTTAFCAIALAAAAPSGLPTKLAAFMSRAEADPTGVAKQLREEFAATVATPIGKSPNIAGNLTLPIVVTHGMGDSCFNPGMKSITKASGEHGGVYATCVPTGKNDIEDTINGFLLNMDKSVDVFAATVRADPNLKNGFNAFGLSQGNNLIHGYQLKYNDPPVVSFVSICGINGGVAAFPNCGPGAPVIGSICEEIAEVLGPAADLEIVQDVLFQANYYRDPKATHNESYMANNQLAQWNGEGKTVNASYKTNFLKTTTNVWVKGTLDTVVWPRESEQWQSPDSSAADPFKAPILKMENTNWYTSDAFGLKTAAEDQKMFYEEFKGEHIRMTEVELFSWISKYFK